MTRRRGRLDAYNNNLEGITRSRCTQSIPATEYQGRVRTCTYLPLLIKDAKTTRRVLEWAPLLPASRCSQPMASPRATIVPPDQESESTVRLQGLACPFNCPTATCHSNSLPFLSFPDRHHSGTQLNPFHRTLLSKYLLLGSGGDLKMQTRRPPSSACFASCLSRIVCHCASTTRHSAPGAARVTSLGANKAPIDWN